MLCSNRNLAGSAQFSQGVAHIAKTAKTAGFVAADALIVREMPGSFRDQSSHGDFDTATTGHRGRLLAYQNANLHFGTAPNADA